MRPSERLSSIQWSVAGIGPTADSLNVANMTEMLQALDATVFVKNGSCLAGLGAGGEGYASFSIATTTGEGITTPMTFTRKRRCVLVDQLRSF